MIWTSYDENQHLKLTKTSKTNFPQNVILKHNPELCAWIFSLYYITLHYIYYMKYYIYLTWDLRAYWRSFIVFQIKMLCSMHSLSNFRVFCEGRREGWSPVSAAFMVLETSIMVQKTLAPDVGVQARYLKLGGVNIAW